MRARKSKRKSTSPYPTSSPATSRLGRNRTSGAPSVLRSQRIFICTAPKGTVCTGQKQRLTLDSAKQQYICSSSGWYNNRYTVSSGIDLSYPLPQLYPQLLVIICPLFSLLILHPSLVFHIASASIWHNLWKKRSCR